jgi:hypothetical protein
MTGIPLLVRIPLLMLSVAPVVGIAVSQHWRLGTVANGISVMLVLYGFAGEPILRTTLLREMSLIEAPLWSHIEVALAAPIPPHYYFRLTAPEADLRQMLKNASIKECERGWIPPSRTVHHVKALPHWWPSTIKTTMIEVYKDHGLRRIHGFLDKDQNVLYIEVIWKNAH